MPWYAVSYKPRELAHHIDSISQLDGLLPKPNSGRSYDTDLINQFLSDSLLKYKIVLPLPLVSHLLTFSRGHVELAVRIY